MQKTIVNDGDELQEEVADNHSEEIQEIIDRVPGWIINWGIAIFGGILIIFAVISMLITYPDMVKASIKIKSSESSGMITANVGGRLSKILVTSGEKVKKGQILALVDSAGDTVHVHKLVADQNGSVKFVSIIEEGYYLHNNEQAFIISPENAHFFGIITIPQNHINKIKLGQTVIIKLNGSTPQNGEALKGIISYIADVPDNRGLFSLKVTLNAHSKQPVRINNWMTGQAEIVTENVSIASRIYNSIISGLK
jgi:HlyD family secretion protein